VDGHSDEELRGALNSVQFRLQGTPTVIIAKTVKGKGVPMIEGHGVWHHRIPNEAELAQIMEALS
jgi:transketolase